MQKLANVLGKIFSDPELKDLYLEAKVLNKFPDVVGEKIAMVTKPYAYKDGVLFVKVLSAPWRQELGMMTYKIQHQMNRDLTNVKIKKIVFR